MKNKNGQIYKKKKLFKSLKFTAHNNDESQSSERLDFIDANTSKS